MRSWLGKRSKSLLGYIPTIVKLMKNWYSFHFLSEKDLEITHSIPWVHGKSFLALQHWYIGYNPLKNTPTNNLIWFKLPGLPIELCQRETLADIENVIGKFIYVDPKYLGGEDKRVEWILIEKEFRRGFPDHIELHWGGLNIIQILDFWGIPFSCSNYHKTSHLKENCPFSWRGRYKEKEFCKKDVSNFSNGKNGEAVGDIRKLFLRSSTSGKTKSSSPLRSSLMKVGAPSPYFSPLAMHSHRIPSPSYGKEKISPIPSCPPVPFSCLEVPQPAPCPHPMANLPSYSNITYVSSSTPSPVNNLSKRKGSYLSENPQDLKGKNPCISITPPNSLVISPTNSVGSDPDLLLKKKYLELCPLTIHKPGLVSSPHINPNLTCNITVKRKQNRGSRHVRGRGGNPNMAHSLIDIPIIDLSDIGPLRAREAEVGP